MQSKFHSVETVKNIESEYGDLISPSETHGDVIVAWTPAGYTIRTHGHVFTNAEMQRLIPRVGLKIVQRWVVHCESGAQRGLALRGNLLYQLAADQARRRPTRAISLGELRRR